MHAFLVVHAPSCSYERNEGAFTILIWDFLLIPKIPLKFLDNIIRTNYAFSIQIGPS